MNPIRFVGVFAMLVLLCGGIMLLASDDAEALPQEQQSMEITKVGNNDILAFCISGSVYYAHKSNAMSLTLGIDSFGQVEGCNAKTWLK